MNPPKPHLAVAYLHPGEVSAAFSMSLLKLMLHETFRAGFPPLVIANRCAAGNIVAARNEVVQQFLDGTDIDWLLFSDSDMGFAPDSAEKLIASADPADRPVVGGLCFAVRRVGTDPETQAERFACAPTVYAWHEFEDRAGFQVLEHYERDAMVLSSATGAAFVLIHRTVLEQIRETYGDRWFDRIPHEKPKPHGTLFSEDMSFCIRVAGVDKPLYVNTAVKTCHDKGGVFFDEDAYDRQQALAAPVVSSSAA